MCFNLTVRTVLGIAYDSSLEAITLILLWWMKALAGIGLKLSGEDDEQAVDPIWFRNKWQPYGLHMHLE